MKKWENNLRIINGFIDYLSLDEDERFILKCIAEDYIYEDHVDGKDSEDCNNKV